MKHSLSLSPKALTLSTGHTRILKAHAIYKVWDYQRGTAAGSWEDVEDCVCVWERERKLSKWPLPGGLSALVTQWGFVMRGFWPFEQMSTLLLLRADVLRFSIHLRASVRTGVKAHYSKTPKDGTTSHWTESLSSCEMGSSWTTRV